MAKSLIQEKSFSFAVRIVRYCRTRLSVEDDVVLSRQLLRSGTSVGANVEEALGGQSRKDFIAKLGIAAREARETHYWLRLLQRVGPDQTPEGTALLKECEELLKILNSIILTTRRNLLPSKPSHTGAQNSRLTTHNSAFSTQNSPLQGVSSELNTQNSDLPGANSELRIQNSELSDGGGGS